MRDMYFHHTDLGENQSFAELFSIVQKYVDNLAGLGKPKSRMKMGKYKLAFGRREDTQNILYFFEADEHGKYRYTMFVVKENFRGKVKYSLAIGHGQELWDKPEVLPAYVATKLSDIQNAFKQWVNEG